MNADRPCAHFACDQNSDLQRNALSEAGRDEISPSRRSGEVADRPQPTRSGGRMATAATAAIDPKRTFGPE